MAIIVKKGHQRLVKKKSGQLTERHLPSNQRTDPLKGWAMAYWTGRKGLQKPGVDGTECP